MRYLYSNEEDRLLFSKILNQNVSLLTGINNVNFKDRVVDLFFQNLDYLNIYDWNEKRGHFKKNVHGETMFSHSGHTGINMYGNKGYKGTNEYISKLFSHEIWHALMTVLNSVYGKTTETNIKVRNKDLLISNYSGFFLCKDDKEEFMVGYLLAEVMADILSHVVYELNNEDEYNIDDAFYYNIDDSTMDAPYDDFLTLVQLFIAAFNIDANFSYGANYQSGNGLLGYYVDLNGKRSIANMFIEGIITNPISIMEEYDLYMGNGSYINLLWDLDLVYSDYIKTKIMNVEVLKSISDSLKIFTSKRLDKYLDKGLINQADKDAIENNFNELWLVFREEIDSYEVKVGSTILRNIVKKLRR